MMLRRTGRNALGATAFVAALAGLGIGGAFAKDAATLLGLHFPAEVAGFRFQDTTDYEKRQRGLGYSAYYRQGDAWADVYVYDLTRKDIPRAYNAAASKAQYDQAAGDIAAAAKQGYYRSAGASGGLEEPGFVCGRFAIVDKDGNDQASVLCVRNWQGKFLKVRLTGPKGGLDDTTIDRFMGAWNKP